MQLAKLKALFKKGPKTKLPINLSSTTYVKSLGKSNAWVDQKHKALHKFWWRFKEKICLSYLAEKISNRCNTGVLTGMILIGLQKAFHTID